MSRMGSMTAAWLTMGLAQRKREKTSCTISTCRMELSAGRTMTSATHLSSMPSEKFFPSYLGGLATTWRYDWSPTTVLCTSASVTLMPLRRSALANLEARAAPARRRAP